MCLYLLCVDDQKKQVELGDSLDLNSYLLKPIQRMTKYALLLQQMMKECCHDDADPQYADLKVTSSLACSDQCWDETASSA